MAKKGEIFKVHVPMDKEITKWLENLGIDAKASGGFRLAKTTIIKACVRAVMELDLNVDGVKTEDELVKKIQAAIRRTSK